MPTSLPEVSWRQLPKWERVAFSEKEMEQIEKLDTLIGDNERLYNMDDRELLEFAQQVKEIMDA